MGLSDRELNVLREAYETYQVELWRVGRQAKAVALTEFTAVTQGLLKGGVPAQVMADALGCSTQTLYSAKASCRRRVLNYSRSVAYQVMRDRQMK